MGGEVRVGEEWCFSEISIPPRLSVHDPLFESTEQLFD
jgi:hypothetical protein